MDEATGTPTKQQTVYRSLRKDILTAQLKPGERLVIDRIAEAHQVSAIPVREALSQLEREGLVEIRPHAGAMVTDIPASAIQEIFALLEAMEVVSCRLGMTRLTTNDLSFLKDLADKMEETEDAEDWLNLNRLFHESVPRLAGLPRLEEQIVKVGESWERLRRLRFAGRKGEDKARADRQHHELVEALTNRDEEAAIQVIQDHNREALNLYMS